MGNLKPRERQGREWEECPATCWTLQEEEEGEEEEKEVEEEEEEEENEEEEDEEEKEEEECVKGVCTPGTCLVPHPSPGCPCPPAQGRAMTS